MATPTNKKQTILELIQTTLAAISATGGNYFFSYASKVHLNKTSTFESFGINVRDESENFLSQDSSGCLQDNELFVEIDIVCTDAAELINIYKNEADVLKCIGNNLTWGGYVFNTEYISSIRDKVDQLGNKLGDMTIRVRITYRKTAWNL